MKTKYRIVSDGIRYKIEYLSRSSRWSRKLKWKYLGRYHPAIGWMSITEYSIEDAEKTLRGVKAEDKAREQGYKVVAEY